jgi:hypothetical protein
VIKAPAFDLLTADPVQTHLVLGCQLSLIVIARADVD